MWTKTTFVWHFVQDRCARFIIFSWQVTILGHDHTQWSINSKDDIKSIDNKEPVQDISEGHDVRSLLIGGATTAFAGLCFTSANTMVKLLPPGSSYDILLLRSLIQVRPEYMYKKMEVYDNYPLFMQKHLQKLPYICCLSKHFLSQMQLMLPLVIRADKGFYGAEDWQTK